MLHMLFRSLVLATCLITVLAGTVTFLLPLALGQPSLLAQWETPIALAAFSSYLLLLALDWPMIRQRHSRRRRIFS